ncbi:MAG: hypothetical protein HZB20_09395 [Chloroflexi bacterium]|nr:hypothetical protein [Chloroflexota bacterium]
MPLTQTVRPPWVMLDTLGPLYRSQSMFDEVRVFYDVSENTVEILAIVPKGAADEWLEEAGK